MTALLKKLWNEEEGQGMVEYGLILALVAVVVIAALTTMGDNLKSMFESVGDEIPTEVPAGEETETQ
jgi:pilus assembly protein Flp/PilA